MLRWKILKSVFVVLPLLAVLFSPFLDPIKRRALNRSDLRLFARNDLTARSQTFAIHNAGEAGLSKVFLGLKIPDQIDRPIADFYFASNESVPLSSFVEALAHSDGWSHLSLDDQKKISPIADDHSSSRTLYDLDSAFDSLLIAKLNSEKDGLNTALNDLRKSTRSPDDWHQVWLQNCNFGRVRNPACPRINSTMEAWESNKRTVQMAAFKQWHETAGIDVWSPTRRFSPNGWIYFAFTLGPDESGFLRIRFGPNSLPFPEPLITSNPKREITTVTKEADLFATSPWVFARYYPFRTVFWIALILICIRLAWPVIRPPSLLPTFAIFNLAIRTNDPSHWELASQRYKFDIFREYRRLWNRFKGTDLPHSPEEIFDFIRICAISEEKEFKTESALNLFTNTQLEQWIRLP